MGSRRWSCRPVQRERTALLRTRSLHGHPRARRNLPDPVQTAENSSCGDGDGCVSHCCLFGGGGVHAVQSRIHRTRPSSSDGSSSWCVQGGTRRRWRRSSMRRRSRSGTIPQADRDDGRRQDHGLGVACALDIGDSVRAIPFRKVIFGTTPAAGFHSQGGSVMPGSNTTQILRGRGRLTRAVAHLDFDSARVAPLRPAFGQDEQPSSSCCASRRRGRTPGLVVRAVSQDRRG